MSDNKGEPTKKKQPQQQQLSSSSPPFNISLPLSSLLLYLLTFAVAESSDTTTSTATHSQPVPTLSAASIHDTNKPAGESPDDDQIQTQQIRKGKFVSPVIREGGSGYQRKGHWRREREFQI